MLWHGSHISHGFDGRWSLGVAGGIETFEWTATEVAIELSPQCCNAAGAFLGKLGRCHCDGLQWVQLIHWIHAGKARFGEQYCCGCIKWNDLQEYKGRETDDDLRRDCCFGGRRMGSHSKGAVLNRNMNSISSVTQSSSYPNSHNDPQQVFHAWPFPATSHVPAPRVLFKY